MFTAVQFSIEEDFNSTGEVIQPAVDREMKRVREHIEVNQAYITDCVNDARKRRQHHGSVVQSYSLGEKHITANETKQIIINIAIISESD